MRGRTERVGGPYHVDEGGSVVLDASGSSDLEQSAASLTYEWDLDGDGTYGETGIDAARGDETGITPTFLAGGLDGPGSLSVGLIVTDSFGATDATAATITVDNVAPQDVNAGADQTVGEGTPVSLSGSFTDPGVNDTHTETWTVVASNGQVIPAGLGSTFGFTPVDTVTYTVTYTVTDNDGDSSSDEAVITVDNLAPVIESLDSSASSLLDKSDDRTVTINGSFSDPGLLDTHVVLVDWGDGSDAVEVTVDPITRTFEGAHVYGAGGIYTVTVTVTDDGNLSDTETTTSVITGIGVVDGTLYIIGTDGRDHVQLKVSEKKDELTVDAKFRQGGSGTGSDGGSDHVKQTYVASDITRVVAFLCDGDDHYNGGSDGGSDEGRNGGSDIEIRQLVFGGDGKDILDGGRWNDAIFGGRGDDDIKGRNGHDILVGGDGKDSIKGGRGNDLLIGGLVENDLHDPSIIDEIDRAMIEWASGNLAETMVWLGNVIDDDEKDDLFGEQDADEFISAGSDTIKQ